ncbi:hypothetical protein [Amorphus sp. 3PC139-8]|uniref:hypothetical protein n=1 Tax=Amorphus sp. 3PC139-8 TaxID=2735676 RepID=UPI00345D51B4
MKLSTLTLTVAALAASFSFAHAQQGSMMNRQGMGMMQGQSSGDDARPGDGQSYRYGPHGRMPWAGRGMGPWMMNDDYDGPNMMRHRWGPQMMGPGMMMGGGMTRPTMMIIMLDTNGDGKLSLEEFQAVHTRMFNYLDKNGDGQLEMDEIGPRRLQDDDE